MLKTNKEHFFFFGGFFFIFAIILVFALWAEILLAEDGAGDIIIYEKQSWVTLMRVSALFFNLFPFFFGYWKLEYFLFVIISVS